MASIYYFNPYKTADADKFTNEDFLKFETAKMLIYQSVSRLYAIKTVITCPSGDYSNITTFPSYCVFGNGCIFGDNTYFGAHSFFGDYCEFGSKCRFQSSNNFGGYCRFGNDITINENATIGDGAIFGYNTTIYDNATFLGTASFGSDHAGERLADPTSYIYEGKTADRLIFYAPVYATGIKNANYIKCYKKSSFVDCNISTISCLEKTRIDGRCKIENAAFYKEATVSSQTVFQKALDCKNLFIMDGNGILHKTKSLLQLVSPELQEELGAHCPIILIKQPNNTTEILINSKPAENIIEEFEEDGLSTNSLQLLENIETLYRNFMSTETV